MQYNIAYRKRQRYANANGPSRRDLLSRPIALAKAPLGDPTPTSVAGTAILVELFWALKRQVKVNRDFQSDNND